MNDANNRLVVRLLRGYNLNYETILPPQKGYRNQSYPIRLASGAIINLILHKTEPGALEIVQRANSISTYLHERGFPCRIMRGPIAKLSNGTTTKYAAIYNYLPGVTIPWEAYTMRHIKVAGKTLSDIHAALAAYNAPLPDIAASNVALNQRMLRYFADPQVASALKGKLGLRVRRADFRPLLAFCQKLSDKQALHMDFVRGNILFEGKGETLRVSGILDFEKAAHGSILFDIARTLAFLLVDCKYKPQDKVYKYFLRSGYQKRGAANLAHTTATKRLLHELINFNLLHDFYKFLRHNPYECLPQNEHFIRTRHLLQTRNIIE